LLRLQPVLFAKQEIAPFLAGCKTTWREAARPAVSNLFCAGFVARFRMYSGIAIAAVRGLMNKDDLFESIHTVADLKDNIIT
jgi:hypothetical protein